MLVRLAKSYVSVAFLDTKHLLIREAKVMQVIRLEALSDNYIFLLYDRKQNIAAVVDPAESQPVLKKSGRVKS